MLLCVVQDDVQMSVYIDPFWILWIQNRYRHTTTRTAHMMHTLKKLKSIPEGDFKKIKVSAV